MGLKRCLVYSNANSYLTIYIFKDQIYVSFLTYSMLYLIYVIHIYNIYEYIYAEDMISCKCATSCRKKRCFVQNHNQPPQCYFGHPVPFLNLPQSLPATFLLPEDLYVQVCICIY